MAEAEATPTEGEDSPAMAASPIADGEPADANISEQVNTAVANLFACYNEGNFLGFAALYTEAGLESEFGTRNPYDAEAFLAGGPPLQLIAVENVRQLEPGRYSAEVTFSFGGTQLQREQWVLIAADRFLFIDQVMDLSAAPAGAVTIEAAMVDYAFELSETTVPATRRSSSTSPTWASTRTNWSSFSCRKGRRLSRFSTAALALKTSPSLASPSPMVASRRPIWS